MRAVSLICLVLVGGAVAINKHQKHHSKHASKYTVVQKKEGNRYFCFAVVQPEVEPTAKFTALQLAACDGHSFYSNFNDAKQGIVKATDRSLKTESKSYGNFEGAGAGSANAEIFKDIWNHVAKTEKGYDFYVKVDPDTFLRPSKLRQVLKEKSSAEAVVFSDDMDNKPTGVLGSMYILSKAALAKYEEKSADCDKNVNSPFEDQYMEECMKRQGVKIEHPNNGFTEMLSNGGTSSFMLTKETAYWPELTDSDFQDLAKGKSFCIKDYIKLPNLIAGKPIEFRGGKKKCFAPDVAAIHPVKDPKNMEMLAKLLGQ